MTANKDPQQIKQQIKSIFDLVAGDYDNPSTRFFPFTADRMVDLIKATPGSKVLDMATGTGMAAIACAQTLGKQGRVQAIDLSDKMLDKASVNIQKTGLNNIDLHTMDAEQLEFRSQYFDAAFCSYGLFFLPDMLAGMKEVFRVLKPGGRFIFTSFAKTSFSPLVEQFQRDVEAFGVEFPKGNWLLIDEEQPCLDLLHETGFEQPQAVTEQLGYHLNNSEDWWELLWSSGYRGVLEQLAPEQLQQFKASHLSEVDKLATEKGLWLNIKTIFSMGTRPT